MWNEMEKLQKERSVEEKQGKMESNKEERT